MDTNKPNGESWRTRLAADLIAYDQEQRDLFGGVDEVTLAQYDDGTLTASERDRVQRALRDHPALQECLDLIRQVDEDDEETQSVPLLPRRRTAYPEPRIKPEATGKPFSPKRRMRIPE